MQIDSDVNSVTGKGVVRRKVKKTRTFMDAKGYMCTEDYSEFEECSADDYEKEQAAIAQPFKATRKPENIGEKRQKAVVSNIPAVK